MEDPKTLLLLSSLLCISIISQAADIITKTQFLSDGETIVSSGESFVMGFFSPGNSKNRYVGIWYKKIPNFTVVWVANREAPLTNKNGTLKFVGPGIIVLVNSTNHTIWSTTASRTTPNPVVQLLDSGNLVVKDSNDDGSQSADSLWQSFDYPCDTLLPGMKLGKDFITGLERYLSSWNTDDDPARDDYTYKINPQGYPQAILSKGSEEVYGSGPWNGVRYSGRPNLSPNRFYQFGLVFNEKEVYYQYKLIDQSVVSRLVLTASGNVQRLEWNPTKGWKVYLSSPSDICDNYNSCGPYGSCQVTGSPVCRCLSSKFVPKRPEQWESGDWSSGCVRRTPMNCSTDGFLTFSRYKLPDTRYSWFNRSMTLKECKVLCLRNCSCMAYSSLNISGGESGCLIWPRELVDMRQFDEKNGQDIYIRMASSELGRQGFRGKTREIVAVTVASLTGILFLGLGLILYLRSKKNLRLQGKKNLTDSSQKVNSDITHRSQEEDLELPVFDLATIAKATDNFSDYNKLGEGGFGPVYKGMLEGGQEIAVKRLSENSIQGISEFKNEVTYVAKLQHRNLVKLLGCCIEGEEKMLIYEYMPNKSLDYFIFDSRLRIIHRDLKASNILLDSDMNARISDFGMARSFGTNETEANTQRVVGTHGWIILNEIDVFSFGVLVLEIVSGKKNRSFCCREHSLNLLGHAWRCYNEGKMEELIDHFLRDSSRPVEVLRLIHVGLLCVQQNPEDRPSMASVVVMLGSETALPNPKQPGFFIERRLPESFSSSSKEGTSSVCEITISLLNGR
ncbi:Non-specific serine/threonine protein kinase [Bertholletia excelsa]